MSSPYIVREQLASYLTSFLQTERFRDYCPNGLQVEGKTHIRRIVTGVTASLALIQEAIKHQADAILVHHGYFWKNENATITHIKQQRIKMLLSHDINLFAYHLPLDAHPKIGNNITLAYQLGVQQITNHEDALIYRGTLPEALSLRAFGKHIEDRLNHKPLLLGDPEKIIKKIAWCTGAAQSYFSEVSKEDIDAYITGEVSEYATHLAQESGMAFIAAGHHATERYGIQALGSHLQAEFNIEHQYIELANPV